MEGETAPTTAVATNVVVPVQLAQLALQRRNSDALAKIDTFLESLMASTPSKAALDGVATTRSIPTKKRTLDGGTYVDMHHELGIDILVNVFSDFEASGTTAYSTTTQRDEEKKQLWLLRQSLAKQKVDAAPDAPLSPSKHDLLKDRYGVAKPATGLPAQLTRRALFSKQKQPSSFNLGVLMEVEMEHRLKELFSLASNYSTTMNKDQVHKLSARVVDMNQSSTLGCTPLEPAERAHRVVLAAQSLLQKDDNITFGSFKSRFLKLSPRRSLVHTQQVAWLDSVYQAFVNTPSPSSPPKPVSHDTESPRHPQVPPKAAPPAVTLSSSTRVGPVKQTSPRKPGGAPSPSRRLKHEPLDSENKPWMTHAAREIVTPMADTSHHTSNVANSSSILDTSQDVQVESEEDDALDALDHSLKHAAVSPGRRTKRDSVDLTKEMGVPPRWKKRDSVELTHAKRTKEHVRPAAIVYDNKGQAPNIRQKLHECKVMMLSLSNLNFGKK